MGTLRDRVTPSSHHIPGISDTTGLSELRGTELQSKCINYRRGAVVDISYLAGLLGTPVNTWLRNVNEGQDPDILYITEITYFCFAGTSRLFSIL